MLDKAHNPSGRIVRGRIACLIVVLSTSLYSLLATGNTYAAAPLAVAVGSVTTAGASVAAGALAPVDKAATQAMSPAPNPATVATQVPDVAVAPLGKTPLPGAAAGGVAPLAKVVIQSAPAVVAPLAKAATQSAGQVVEPVGKAAARALAPAVQGAARVLAPTSSVLHRATSSLGTAGNALTTVIVSAAGRVTGTHMPASTAGGNLISAPQGAPAALRGAIGAIGTLGAAGGASGCALSRLQGLPRERCVAGSLPRLRSPARLPLPPEAAAGAALGTSVVRAAPDRSGGARDGPGFHVVPGAVPIPTPSEASGSAAALGFAVSISLTLAGLLPLAAPRALRRLRLPREPWLQARFVLIPERPG